MFLNRHLAALALLAFGVPAEGQTLGALGDQWQRIVSEVQQGRQSQASGDFADFNQEVRSYVRSNGLDWQVEYLAGSLYCLFPDSKATGAEYLKDILQNNRTLNEQGDAELQRQLSACQSRQGSTSIAAQMTVPQNLTDAAAHFQSPGIRADMKSGGGMIADRESSSPVSPVAASALMARRVDIGNPQLALQNAVARLPRGAKGAVVGDVTVVTEAGAGLDAHAIGNCLQSYDAPLHAGYQIDSPSYMVTAYAVEDPSRVYDLARMLHGFNLPVGVIAYSVPEDMSLVSPAGDNECGSMAHEMVHLLIKPRFPDAPAWLEEGFASEVAIAAPLPATFRFEWSWRDSTLLRTKYLRPTVAELIVTPWSGFSSSSVGVEQAASTQAMAAVFIRYLDARGKLPAVYYGVRDRHFGADLSGFVSYQSILEAELKMPVGAIDADFEKWFDAEVKTHEPGPDPSTGGDSGQDWNHPANGTYPISPNSNDQPHEAPNAAPNSGNAVPDGPAPSPNAPAQPPKKPIK
ncbi:MAG: hypothetical protein WAL75_24900 [Terracidiphilus sp.]